MTIEERFKRQMTHDRCINSLQIKQLLLVIWMIIVGCGCDSTTSPSSFSSSDLVIENWTASLYTSGLYEGDLEIDTYIRNNSERVLNKLELHAEAFDSTGTIIGTGYSGQYFTSDGGNWVWKDDFINPQSYKNKSVIISFLQGKTEEDISTIKIRVTCNLGEGTGLTLTTKTDKVTIFQ